jgi:hypothetical protein
LARVVVFFGPPGAGKSYSIKREQEKYKKAQIVSIDKDVINTYFFHPTLIKTPPPSSPTDILWKTTSNLVELLAVEFKDILEQAEAGTKKELVVFLQGVTLGGVQSDIETLLSAGFLIEFVFLTVENPLILYKRITDRAKEPDFVGSPPMPVDKLESISKSCNLAIKNIVESLNETAAGSVGEHFYECLRKYKSSITYRVELTRLKSGKTIELTENSILMATKLSTDTYKGDQIKVENDQVILGKGSPIECKLATG